MVFAPVALLLCLDGCAANRAMQVPPGQPAVVSSDAAGSSAERDKAQRPVATLGLRADGGSCFSGSQCESTICEGASCDGQSPGTCVPEDRVCTVDVVEYCGCDGQTFVSSSSCPGEAFEKLGRCDSDTPTPQ